MVLINAWILFTWLFSFKMVCSSRNSAIQHLNMRFERLNRITDGLKRDVDDIWTAMSVTAVHRQTETSNNIYQGETKSGSVMHLVNETVSDVKELKTEVEELAHIVKHGFQQEKMFSRDKVKNMENHQDEFQTDIKREISDMKRWLQLFQDDMLETMKLKTEEDNRKCQLIIKNITNDFTIKLEQNKMDTAVCYDTLDRVVQNVTAAERKMNSEMDTVKSVINEKLSQATACDNGWEKFHDHCYKVYSFDKTWDEASNYCQSRNSYIAEIDSHEELDFLIKKCAGLHYCWVGASDRQNEGRFIWQNSKQMVSNAYWKENEPNNAEGNENCAHLYAHTTGLNDNQCNHEYSFTCERSQSYFLIK